MESLRRRERHMGKKSMMTASTTLIMMVLASACSPTIKVEAPDKPIVINLNVRIEQEVRIRVEKGVEDLLVENPDIF